MYEDGRGTMDDWLADANKDVLVGFFKEALNVITPDMVEALFKDTKDDLNKTKN